MDGWRAIVRIGVAVTMLCGAAVVVGPSAEAGDPAPRAGEPARPLPSSTCPPAPVLADRCAPRRPCDDEPRRGPVEVRDPYLLAQPRLTLPATSPDTLGGGVTSVRAQFTLGNSFGWGQDETGENPPDRQFLVDGESRTLEVVAMHGVTRDLDLGVRVPLHWRGSGLTDPIIDLFHEATSFFILDNERTDFRKDAYRIEGRTYGGAVFDAGDDGGVGFGDVEAIGRWRFHDGGRDGLSAALVGRLTLPTGTGPFDPGGFGAGLQVVAAHRVARAFDVFAGVGGTWFSDTGDMGFQYEALRGQVFAAVEWRPARTWSLVFGMDWTTALVDDVVRFHPQHFIMNLAAKIDLRSDTTLEIGFIENFVHQQSTVDVAAYVGVEFRR